jgi:hypothetical protein
MKRVGLADHVIVVLSDKYLRSPYCMTELHSIYQRSVGEKEDFLRRIIPLRLDDARFGTPEERVQYAKHWEARYLKLKSDLDHLSDFHELAKRFEVRGPKGIRYGEDGITKGNAIATPRAPSSTLSAAPRAGQTALNTAFNKVRFPLSPRASWGVRIEFDDANFN